MPVAQPSADFNENQGELTEEQREAIRNTLQKALGESLALEQAYETQIRATRNQGADEADEADAEQERRRLQALLDRTKLETRKIALAADAQDSIGECIDCTAPIGLARLMARPSARRCVDCEAVSEKKGGGAGRVW